MNSLQTGTDMKAIRYLLILLLSISSCESGEDTTYIIENQSDHSIRINFYKYKYDDIETRSKIIGSRLTKTIELMNKGDDWQEIQSKIGGTSIFLSLPEDSAVVTFDEEKRQIFLLRRWTDDRNIFNEDSYEVESSCKRKRVYYSTRKYTFVNNDYENAEPIEGD